MSGVQYFVPSVAAERGRGGAAAAESGMVFGGGLHMNNMQSSSSFHELVFNMILSCCFSEIETLES